jgi:hypothetical protein
MSRSRRRWPHLKVSTVLVLALAMLPLGLSSSAGAAPETAARYLLVGPAPAGSTVLADYGGAWLVDLTASQAAAARALGAQLEGVPDAHSLKLMRGTIDTSTSAPAVPAGLAAPVAPTSWIVQFVGPAGEGWYEAVEAAGFHLVSHGYVPENGWLVRGQADAADRVSRLPFVQAVVPYAPYYRIAPSLASLTGAREVRVMLFDDADVSTTMAKLASFGAVELGRIDDADVKLVRVRLDLASLTKVARLDTVQWVELVRPLQLFNDHAADTMGQRPVWTGTADAPGTPFTGAGEIVAVADTGIDTGDPTTIHKDFRDHLQDLQAWGRPGPGGDIHTGDPSDEDGHGTHTSGSVVADGTAWSTLNLAGCTLSCDATKAPKGMAPDAKLVMQSISGPDGSLTGVPEDPGVLYQAAYDAGARVHSDSYGSDAAGVYDTQAFLLDRWMATHPDMLFAFAAGNAGTDADANGIIDFGSIGSPATAKDLLAVGASEDQRGASFASGDAGEALTGIPSGQPLYSTYAVFYVPPAGPPIENDVMSNNREGMVAFSSRGPTVDGRIKPEITAIGTHVLSTRSSMIPDADIEQHYWSRASNGTSSGNTFVSDYPASADPYYAFDGGTSMATPLTAGSATTVRQYLRTARKIVSPSSGLMRAAMTIGAHELAGQYDPLHPDVTARPDNNEGWGRVDVKGTIDPAGPTKSAFYDDPVGLRIGGKARYTFQVTNTTVPLRVQLGWTDVAGNVTVAKSLVNDLDLVVTAPNGTVFRGNMFGPRASGETPSTPNPVNGNHVDTLEGVDVPASAVQAGTWTVDVVGFNVPSAPQKYGLAVRGGLNGVPAGAVHLDAGAARGGGRPVQIAVNDAQADTSAALNKVNVRIKSTSDTTGITRALTETSAHSGVFTGSFTVANPGAPSSQQQGLIKGANGDTITVSYLDALGTVRTATALVDNRPPVVTGTTTGTVTPFNANVAFHSDELATGGVQASNRPSVSTPDVTASDGAQVADHAIVVPGLQGATRYYYRSLATDDPGNVGVDDNGGRLYTFRTKQATVEYSYDAESDAGWTHQTNPDDAAATGEDQWHRTTRADAVHGGSSAWLFGPEDPSANYPTSADAFLDSPPITRTASGWASLDVWANYDTEKGFDGLNFLASDDGGSTYRLLPVVSIGPPTPPALAAAQIDGNSGGYRLLSFDLSSFSGSTLQLRIQFTSDSGVEYGGAAIDDLVVRGANVAPVATALSATASATSLPRGGGKVLGSLKLTPARDWVRVTRIVVNRTGNATDADVPSARLQLPGSQIVTVPFVNGVATFSGLTWDGSAADPLQPQIGVVVAGNAAVGRTAGISVATSNVTLAEPDVMTAGPPAKIGPLTIK